MAHALAPKWPFNPSILRYFPAKNIELSPGRGTLRRSSITCESLEGPRTLLRGLMGIHRQVTECKAHLGGSQALSIPALSRGCLSLLNSKAPSSPHLGTMDSFLYFRTGFTNDH